MTNPFDPRTPDDAPGTPPSRTFQIGLVNIAYLLALLPWFGLAAGLFSAAGTLGLLLFILALYWLYLSAVALRARSGYLNVMEDADAERAGRAWPLTLSTVALPWVMLLGMGFTLVMSILLTQAGAASFLFLALLIIWMVAQANILGRWQRFKTAKQTELREVGASTPTLAEDLGGGYAKERAELIREVRRVSPQLPPSLREQLMRTAQAADAALKATAGQDGRDAYNARAVATEELPDALRAYLSLPESQRRARALPSSASGVPMKNPQESLAEQLQVLEGAMRGVVSRHAEERARELETQRRYLQGKYGEEEKIR